MTRVAIIAPQHNIDYVYGDARIHRIEQMASTAAVIIEPSAVDERLGELADTEVVFSTWGMPCLTEAQLDAMPRFRLLLYAAGSVHGFAHPLLARNIGVMSAWRANGLPVARFALAQIILSLKGYFRNVREYRADPGASRTAYRGPGPHDETVALLGAGAVGRALIELLSPYGLEIVVYDPYLSDADAEALGVRKVGLAEAFATGFVVSNHLADKPEIAGLIDAALLRSMRPGATFVNTARGRTVREDDLVAVLTIVRLDDQTNLNRTPKQVTAVREFGFTLIVSGSELAACYGVAQVKQ